MVGADVHDARSSGLDEVLRERVVARVRREEDHAVGDRERHPSQAPVPLPGLEGTEVGGVVVADQILVRHHQTLAQLGQEGEILGARDLERAVNDVGAGERSLGHLFTAGELDARQRHQHVGGIAAQLLGDDRGDPRLLGSGERDDQLEHVKLSARHGPRQDAPVDHHRQPGQSSAGGTQHAGERPAEVLLGQADRVVVVRIPGGDDPLVLGLDRVGLAVPGEAPAAVMEHQDLVGHDM